LLATSSSLVAHHVGVAKDNLASRRVLEKCGFTVCGEGRGYANARGMEIEEFILRQDT
jgi:RimJ/RimL family protein N-acetyltransferase